MSNFLRNKNCRFGIILGFTLFLLVQLISFAVYAYSWLTFENPPGINIDMYWAFGLPYTIFYGEFSTGYFWWRGILVNLLIAAIFSFFLGLTLKFVRQNPTAKIAE